MSVKYLDFYRLWRYNSKKALEVITVEDNRTYYYGRVSSTDQNLDRQLEAFYSLGAIDRFIITDKASGKDFDRPGYASLKSATGLRRGDTLVVKSLDRLGRNKEAIKKELQWFKDAGIRLKIIDLPTTMMDLPEGQDWIIDMVNNILLEVLSSMAEQERLTIKKRQAEGIACAKEKGRHLGRPAATYPKGWNDVYCSWKRKELTAKAAIEKLNLKRATFYNLVNRFEHEQQQ